MMMIISSFSKTFHLPTVAKLVTGLLMIRQTGDQCA